MKAQQCEHLTCSIEIIGEKTHKVNIFIKITYSKFRKRALINIHAGQCKLVPSCCAETKMYPSIWGMATRWDETIDFLENSFTEAVMGNLNVIICS